MFWEAVSLGLAGLLSVPKAEQCSLLNSQTLTELPLGRRPLAKQWAYKAEGSCPREGLQVVVWTVY